VDGWPACCTQTMEMFTKLLISCSKQPRAPK